MINALSAKAIVGRRLQARPLMRQQRTSGSATHSTNKHSVIFILNLSDGKIWNHCTWRAKRPFDPFPASTEKVEQGAWDPT